MVEVVVRKKGERKKGEVPLTSSPLFPTNLRRFSESLENKTKLFYAKRALSRLSLPKL